MVFFIYFCTIYPDKSPPPFLGSGAVNSYNHRTDEDYYSQAGDLFPLMSAAQKKLLIDNIVGAMKSVPAFIQQRQIAHFMKPDKAYGEGVRDGLAAMASSDSLKVPVTK